MFRGPNWRERLGGVSVSDFEHEGEMPDETSFRALQSSDPGAMPWMGRGMILTGNVWPLPQDAFSYPRSAGTFPQSKHDLARLVTFVRISEKRCQNHVEELSLRVNAQLLVDVPLMIRYGSYTDIEPLRDGFRRMPLEKAFGDLHLPVAQRAGSQLTDHGEKIGGKSAISGRHPARNHTEFVVFSGQRCDGLGDPAQLDPFLSCELWFRGLSFD